MTPLGNGRSGLQSTADPTTHNNWKIGKVEMNLFTLSRQKVSKNVSGEEEEFINKIDRDAKREFPNLIKKAGKEVSL